MQSLTHGSGRLLLKKSGKGPPGWIKLGFSGAGSFPVPGLQSTHHARTVIGRGRLFFTQHVLGLQRRRRSWWRWRFGGSNGGICKDKQSFFHARAISGRRGPGLLHTKPCPSPRRLRHACCLALDSSLSHLNPLVPSTPPGNPLSFPPPFRPAHGGPVASHKAALPWAANRGSQDGLGNG